MLRNIKAPDGYQIKEFDYPSVGDYILLPSGEAFKIDTHHHAYHCGGIILEKEWEPEIGKYYEFDDKIMGYDKVVIRKYVGKQKLNGFYEYEDETGESWRYMRPVQGELGK